MPRKTGYNAPVDTQAEWEDALDEYCREAGLTAIQREIASLMLVDRVTLSQARGMLKLRSGRDARREWHIAAARLSALPGFWAAARQFGYDLVECASNRVDYDDRPAGLRGVEPDRASQRFQGARIISGDDTRLSLRRDPPFAALLWAREQWPGEGYSSAASP